jgi:hypothetical protein
MPPPPSSTGLQSPRGVAAVAALVIAATLLTAARGYRLPHDYPIAHWLLDYGHGFVKRGLVGTLASPLYAWKSPTEIRDVVTTLTLVVLLGALAALTGCAVRLVRTATRPADRALLAGAAVVLATSPLVMNMAYTSGFLDRFLELATLGAIAALVHRRRTVASILVLFGVAVHEVFLVYGLPVVLFTALLARARPEESAGRRHLLGDLAAVLVPAGLAYGAILIGQHLLSDWDVRLIQKDIVRTGVLDATGAGFATFHLTHGFAENAALQSGQVLERLLRWDVWRVVLPPLALLLATSGLLLVRLGRAILILPLLLATGAPLLLHGVAWDTARFTTFTIFHAFVALYALVRCHGDRLAEAPAGRWTRRAGWALVALAVPVTIGNVAMEIPGFPGEFVHDEAFLAVRTGPTTGSFEECRTLFNNSDFEEGDLDGWTATGNAFADAPSRATPPRSTVARQGVIGRWWVSSFRRGRAGDPSALRNRARGTLVSPSFRIDGSHILFTVGGGRHRGSLYVALEVEGREVYRDTGSNREILEPRAWDVRAWRGRDAVIRIVDDRDRRWGHIYADGFCYLR